MPISMFEAGGGSGFAGSARHALPRDGTASATPNRLTSLILPQGCETPASAGTAAKGFTYNPSSVKTRTRLHYVKCRAEVRGDQSSLTSTRRPRGARAACPPGRAGGGDARRRGALTALGARSGSIRRVRRNEYRSSMLPRLQAGSGERGCASSAPTSSRAGAAGAAWPGARIVGRSAAAPPMAACSSTGPSAAYGRPPHRACRFSPMIRALRRRAIRAS